MSPFGRTLIASVAAVPLVSALLLPWHPAMAATPETPAASSPTPAAASATAPEDPGTIPAPSASAPTPAPTDATPAPAPAAPAPATPAPEQGDPAAPALPSNAPTPVTAAAPDNAAPDNAADTGSPTAIMGYAVTPTANEDSPVWAHYLAIGGPASWLGAAVGAEKVGPDGVRVLDLQRGSLYYSATTGVRAVVGDALVRYRQLGEHRSALGLPVAEEVAGSRGARITTFQRGRIYTGPTGTFEVVGPIAERYVALGGENGPLGLPISGDVAGGQGSRASIFEGGRIYWTASLGANEVYGGILQRYMALGAENGVLGLPTSGEVNGGRGSRTNGFQNGRIYWSPSTGTNEVYGAILWRYAALGAENGVLGLPTSGEMPSGGGTRVNFFQSGHIYSSAAGTNEVLGAILMRYLQEGGPGGRLGVPITGEIPWDYGRQSKFSNGTITWNAFNGQTDIPYEVDPAVLARFSPQVARWGSTVSRVLADLGLDQRYVYGILRQINQESGGNPNAVNNNDVNWANGYASFGLLQTIAPTYQSFAPPGQLGTMTWVNVNGRSQRFVPEMVVPYNNIYSGVNYAKTRYGVAKFEAWNAGYNHAY